MFSHLSIEERENNIDYPIQDSKLPFADYIAQTKAIIRERRTDLAAAADPESIIERNAPFEFRPDPVFLHNKRYKSAALLIHGLLDCPFSLRDIGLKLQNQGVLCRSILLPGHGTNPSDMLHVTHQEWMSALRYGLESLRDEADRIYLVGYSTGATLSVYQALLDNTIAGVILIAPAIQIKAPVDIVVAARKFTQMFSNQHPTWLYKEIERDIGKYHSITFNAVSQVAALTKIIRDLNSMRELTCPVYMAISREDETISSHQAIEFFQRQRHQDSRLILYTSIDHRYPDKRIVTRNGKYPNLHINHCSHVSLPFAPTNSYYGIEGTYENASRLDKKNVIYGAYNRLEQQFFTLLYNAKIIKNKRSELTYNPDFEFLAEDIAAFINRD